MPSIQWNKELIYRQLGGPPNNWPRDVVDHNVFNRLAKSELNASAYDKQSIMHYFFPQGVDARWYRVRENSALSPLDVKFIGTQYKKATTAGPA